MGIKIIAQNKRARHDYQLIEMFEAGIVLQGTEVKSLREGKTSISEAFVQIRNGEAFLHNATIPQYKMGNRNNHEETRIRKLLLHGKEIKKINDEVNQKRYTIIATKLYFSSGKAKIEIALAKGKNLYDKRQSEKQKSVEKKIRQGDYE